MADLRPHGELASGGDVAVEGAPHPTTGGWRTSGMPVADVDACINCLLCWIYCPDSAVIVADGVFEGFDYDYCKGCEVCAEMCPIDAIRMVPEERR
jgi:2-oxoacid:acceptor oxidoreductase delta subunit (pyruvate/2-ketoisovalerate family)